MGRAGNRLDDFLALLRTAENCTYRKCGSTDGHLKQGEWNDGMDLLSMGVDALVDDTPTTARGQTTLILVQGAIRDG